MYSHCNVSTAVKLVNRKHRGCCNVAQDIMLVICPLMFAWLHAHCTCMQFAYLSGWWPGAKDRLGSMLPVKAEEKRPMWTLLAPGML